MVNRCDAAEYPSDEEPSDSEDEAPGDAEALEDTEVAAEDTSAAGDGRKRRLKERRGMSAGQHSGRELAPCTSLCCQDVN